LLPAPNSLRDRTNWRRKTDSNRLLRDRDPIGEARDLLAPIYERFTEGFGTADLREAKRLIDALS
jgi:predicted ATPase